jgi:hypothetical protein
MPGTLGYISAQEVKVKLYFRWKGFFWTLAILVVLLVGFRLALPSIVHNYVNKKLAHLNGYRGQIGKVHIHLYRGAYSINNVDVVKTSGDVPVPFFDADKVDLSMQWSELFHGALVGEINVDRGKLNFVKGKTEADSQTGIDDSWMDVVKQLFPFKINKFEIHEGEVWFRDFHAKPKVDVYLTNMVVVCTNLYNTRKFKDELPADFRAHGVTLGGGDLSLQVKLDPLAEQPKFDLEIALKGMDLVALNDMLEAYGKFNVKRGKFELFAEFAGESGKFDGYMKPFFENLDVVDIKEDIKNPIKLAWQGIVAGAVQLFKNHSKDQVATKIPISGRIDNPKMSLWTTISNILRNAFVEAFSRRLDKSIDIFDRSEEGKKQDTTKLEKKKEKESRHASKQ